MSSIDWIGIISGVATLSMAAATFFSVYQNRKQIAELRRQWEEQNSPKIISLLIQLDDYVCLRLKNYSASCVLDLKVKFTINSSTIDSDYCKEMIEKSQSQIYATKYIIEPGRVKDLKLFYHYNSSMAYYSGNIITSIS